MTALRWLLDATQLLLGEAVLLALMAIIAAMVVRFVKWIFEE